LSVSSLVLLISLKRFERRFERPESWVRGVVEMLDETGAAEAAGTIIGAGGLRLCDNE